MAEQTLGADERRILEAVARLRADDEVKTVHAVANEAGVSSTTPVRAVLDRLRRDGFVDAGLRLTEQGREELERSDGSG